MSSFLIQEQFAATGLYELAKMCPRARADAHFSRFGPTKSYPRQGPIVNTVKTWPRRAPILTINKTTSLHPRPPFAAPRRPSPRVVGRDRVVHLDIVIPTDQTKRLELRVDVHVVHAHVEP